RPLCDASGRLHARRAPPVDPRHLRRLPADVRPGGRRLPERPDPGGDEHGHDRLRDPEAVPRGGRLPVGLGLVGDPAGDDARRDRAVREVPRLEDDRGVRVSTLAQEVPVPSARELAPVPRERRRRWTYYVLPVFSAGFFLYLLIPIAFMIIYSF